MIDVQGYIEGVLDNRPALKNFLARYGQGIFNIALFIDLTCWSSWQAYRTWQAGNMNYVEASFTIQNMVMVTFILIRSRHRTVDKNLFNQAVALTAFFSGLLFMGQEPTGGPAALSISRAVIFAANVIGILSLFNLGRSFGILIALRRVKTGGLYSIVRHPMYAGDILLRVGFLISHVNPFTVAVFAISSGAYVYRAVLEETHLSSDEEYIKYMQKVRYRFIPYLF